MVLDGYKSFDLGAGDGDFLCHNTPTYPLPHPLPPDQLRFCARSYLDSRKAP